MSKVKLIIAAIIIGTFGLLMFDLLINPTPSLF
jgi:uncharacterized membrane protein YeiH